jgi:hypothetical protein
MRQSPPRAANRYTHISSGMAATMYMVSVAPKAAFAAWATAYRAKLAALVRCGVPIAAKSTTGERSQRQLLSNQFDLDIVRQYCRLREKNDSIFPSRPRPRQPD